MFGDFREYSLSSDGASSGGGQAADFSRSRSPPSGHRSSGSGRDTETPEPWCTGHAGLDNFAKQGSFSDETKKKLGTVPPQVRRRWLTDLLDKKIENPNAWIGKRFSNWQTDQRVEQVTGMNRFGEPVAKSQMTGGATTGGGARNMGGGGGGGTPQSGGVNAFERLSRPDDIPTWAKRAFQMWPSEKTQLVREVCQRLNSEEMEALTSMEPHQLLQ